MSGAVASLGMYDHPAQRPANEALWRAIAGKLYARGIDAPAALDHRDVKAAWRDPGLLLAQCCGYPLVADPDLDLRVVAVPSYAVADCAPGRHRSRVVVRADEPATALAHLRGRKVAVNAPLSNTGANLLRAAVAPIAGGERFFAGVQLTGSHRASLEAVRTGAADVAAIDAVTYAAIERFEPEAIAGLRQLAVTRSVPALPFVTARSTPAATVAALREALVAAARDPALAAVREALFLGDIVPVGGHRYAAIRTIEREAAALGYPILH
ncbi:phosphate/phosphite/phosphonate ABC transporter substrate-binding protein [Sphingomonas sp. Y38-1Y]|uniref:phosphate/phosphite/phosphonate ABC transporter substrate-binding protein n=1 Tax=Sphingomonas sp. Y38-1Y TaxID=3078265 RepID=UPI0028E37ADF|nr:PhnD/SsuA/transferrin family substrate-binding protein [Sphingomonas sp. Y38-1Y]